MRRLGMGLFSALAGLVMIAGEARADGAGDFERAPLEKLQGEWAMAGYWAVVTLGPCVEPDDGDVCGVLDWLWDPGDAPDVGIGEQMIWGLRWEESDGQWKNGRLKNPQNGNVYTGTVTQLTDDQIALKGCVARIFCRTQVWRRLESLPHPVDASGDCDVEGRED